MQDEAKEEFERELSFQSEQDAAKKPIGGGTKTLAERLSQSLRDPLRSKDYLGTVDKGEITIDCHHHSKIISFKNRKGYLSKNAIENMIDLIQLSDTNWYEKFSILKGGEEGFCAGLVASQNPHLSGRHRDLDAQCLQYRLGWLIARSKRRRMAILDGPCLGAGAASAAEDGDAALRRDGGTTHGRRRAVCADRERRGGRDEQERSGEAHDGVGERGDW